MSALATDMPMLWLAAGLAALLALWLAGGAEAPSRRTLARRIDQVRHSCLTPATPKASELRLARRQRGARFGRFATRLEQLTPNLDRLGQKLEQAGLPLTLGDALIVGLLAAMGVGLALWALGLPAAAALPAGFSLVFGVSALIITQLRQRRALRFLTLLPEAIDLIVRAVKSGLPVSEAIALIGEEVDDPVGEVFRQVASNMRIGMNVEDALWAAVRRIDLPEFRFLVVTINLQSETGGNLAEVLTNLGTMIRKRLQMRLKVRAMSSEARAAAIIIGSLPFLVGTVIFFVNPDYVLKLFVDPRGQWLALGGLLSMATGVLVIARLIRFEI